MAERYELHECQWQLIRDLFPPPKATGRKRRVIELALTVRMLEGFGIYCYYSGNQKH